MRILPLLLLAMLGGAAEPLRLVASVPDLGDLAREVGGDAVVVTVLARGDEDPHTVELRPAFISALAQADVLLEMGLDYDTHWINAALVQNPRPSLLRLKAHEAVTLIKPPVEDDGHGHGHGHGHDHGHQHAAGNPHFLCDPVAAAQVCLALGHTLGLQRPDDANALRQRGEAAALRLARALVGPAACDRLGTPVVLKAMAAGDPTPLIGTDLGGWLGRTAALRGLPLIADHDGWPYLARRFDLAIVGFLEPSPGVPSSTAHLGKVVALGKGAGVRAVIISPWSDSRQADTVSKALNVPTLVLAPQSAALPNAPDYHAAVEWNISTLERLAR